jgi:hypothetical protein
MNDREISPAAADVLIERKRQVDVEEFTDEHDSEHTDDELALAAASYATPPKHRKMVSAGDGDLMPSTWPWESSSWKPKTRRRDLVRAGALIIAEIERLDRLSSRRL